MLKLIGANETEYRHNPIECQKILCHSETSNLQDMAWIKGSPLLFLKNETYTGNLDK